MDFFNIIDGIIDQARASLNMKDLLENNPFFQTAFITAVIGAAIALARKLPGWINRLFIRYFTVAIEIRDKEVFDWLALMLGSEGSEVDLMKHTRNVSAHVFNDFKDNGGHYENVRSIRFAPGIGSHWFWYQKRLWLLTRHRDDPKADGENMMVVEIETFRLHTLGRNTQAGRDLLIKASEFVYASTRKKNLQVVYVLEDGYWERVKDKQPRPISSVILREGIADDIIDYTRDYLNSHAKFRELGIPYRRGLLLYGPPGTGKSSLAEAVAYELKLDLYVLQFSRDMTDKALARALRNLPPKCVLLGEDIDALFKARDSGKTKMSFSGFLNAVDGVAASEGRILIATTNHIEKLDPALHRPGRIDRKFFLDRADLEQASRMFDRFYPEAAAAERSHFAGVYEGLAESLSPAALQVHFQMHPPREATDRLTDLVGNSMFGVIPAPSPAKVP